MERILNVCEKNKVEYVRILHLIYPASRFICSCAVGCGDYTMQCSSRVEDASLLAIQNDSESRYYRQRIPAGKHTTMAGTNPAWHITDPRYSNVTVSLKALRSTEAK
eukprot:762972-Hanusia_phi.AAC.6